MNIEEFAFASTRHFTRGKKRKLLEIYPTVSKLLEACDSDILHYDIVSEKELSDFREELASLKLKETYRRFLQSGFNLVLSYDEAFPEQLRYIHEPPVALFFNGTLPTYGEKLIAMVGARRCSAYGRVMAGKIASDLAACGYSVISGMAYGVDSYSHRGALEGGGRTYAFVANGLDICYPETNRDLYEEIPKHGAIITEFALGTQPIPDFFPDRNRLISGLSRAVLVIEARERSGSLITADFALDQGRDVYALPGKITDPLSAGTNRLISQGAGIIRSSEALLEELELSYNPDAAEVLKEEIKNSGLNPDEIKVYSAFDFNAKSIDEVQAECGLTLLEILGIVSTLTEKGFLKEVFLNHYVRNMA